MSTSQPPTDVEPVPTPPAVPIKPPSRRGSFVGGAPKSPTHRSSRTNSPRDYEPPTPQANEAEQHSTSSIVRGNGVGPGLSLPSTPSAGPGPMLVDMSNAKPAEPLSGPGMSSSVNNAAPRPQGTASTPTSAAPEAVKSPLMAPPTHPAPSAAPSSASEAADLRAQSVWNDTNADKLGGSVNSNAPVPSVAAAPAPAAATPTHAPAVAAPSNPTTTSTGMLGPKPLPTANSNAAPPVNNTSAPAIAAVTPVPAPAPSAVAPPPSVVSPPMSAGNVAPTNNVASTPISSTPTPPPPAAMVVTASPVPLAGPGRRPSAATPVAPSVRPALSSITGLERVAAIPKLQGSSDRLQERVGTCVHNLMVAKCPERLDRYAEVMRMYEGKEEVLLDALHAVFGDEHFFGQRGRPDISLLVGGLNTTANNFGNSNSNTNINNSAARRRSQSPNTTAILNSNTSNMNNSFNHYTGGPAAAAAHPTYSMGSVASSTYHQPPQQHGAQSVFAARSSAMNSGAVSRTGSIMTPALPRDLQVPSVTGGAANAHGSVARTAGPGASNSGLYGGGSRIPAAMGGASYRSGSNAY